MPTISKHEYFVHSKGEDFLKVVAFMHTIGYKWPDKITHLGETYKFRQNEVMENWMIGNYSGHAKYTPEDQ